MKITEKQVAIFIIILIVLDQILKIWIKTTMTLGEAIIIFPDWFQLRFIENNGAAFGMQISNSGSFDWGKLLLSLFRIATITYLGFMLRDLVKKSLHPMIIIPFAMVIAGAIGNLVDSTFYGLIFSESTVNTVAHFGGSYSAPLMGRVVDMFYFPLFKWDNVPSFLSFLVDGNNYFFGAIFNLADSYISVGVVLFLLFGVGHFDKVKQQNNGRN